MRPSIYLLFVSLPVLIAAGCGQSSGDDKAGTKPADSTSAKNPSTPSVKEQLLGSWIQQESGAANIKMVFSNNEAIKYDNGQKEDSYTYKWLNDKQVEMVVKGTKITAGISIAGDVLEMDVPGMGVIKYLRDAGNASATGTSAADSIQAVSKLLLGKWRMAMIRKTTDLEFSANGSYTRTEIKTYEDPQFGPDKSSVTHGYRVTSGKTVEITGTGETATFEIQDNGSTLKWEIKGVIERFMRL